MEATQDPDAFIFQKQYNSEVEEFKKIVEAAMRDSKNSKTLASPTSLADEIRKLATLVEDGFLSDDEFEVAKRKLLASP
ncbi:hypothetical protein CSZ94_17370 [Janthinobacterium sp. ROICE36]|nr:hypothetical protein CSZ94_17370 [Janthinobacterium sp. ROICE36]